MVKKISINGAMISDKEDLYQIFMENLFLPEWHGHNLDALWDTLSVWSESLQIEVEQQELILAALGQYGDNFLEMLDELAEENSSITVQR